MSDLYVWTVITLLAVITALLIWANRKAERP